MSPFSSWFGGAPLGGTEAEQARTISGSGNHPPYLNTCLMFKKFLSPRYTQPQRGKRNFVLGLNYSQ